MNAHLITNIADDGELMCLQLPDVLPGEPPCADKDDHKPSKSTPAPPTKEPQNPEVN